MIESTDTIRILAPIQITAAMITSSTISPEDTAPVWASGTTYADGARVYMASTHRVYESLQGSNLGKDPSLPANQVDSTGAGTWWLDVGPTNLFAMFDGLVSTQSVKAGTLTVVLHPGAFNGYALFGLDGDTISITQKDAPGGAVVYSYSGDLEGSAPPDYYEYFFDPFKPQTRLIGTDLPAYNDSEITITVTKVTGDAKIGLVALGDMRPLGAPLRGASVEPVDYSYISTDQFGVTTVKKRYNATGLVISGQSSIEDASAVLDTVKNLLGIPCVVIGSEAPNFDGLTVFGLVSGRMSYPQADEVTLNLTVKGLV